MEVKVDSVLKERFIGALQERYGGVRDGVHVSDLVYCLRQTFYRKIDPEPFTERQLGFFVDGARRHTVLQELLDVESEVKVEKWGIYGSIDMVLDYPLEIKTTRAHSSLPDHYFKQLGYYAVLVGKNKGYLVVLRLNSEVPWEFYSVEWSSVEIEELTQEMKMRARDLCDALERKDPSVLPNLSVDMEWKCRYCLYRERCGTESAAGSV